MKKNLNRPHSDHPYRQPLLRLEIHRHAVDAVAHGSAAGRRRRRGRGGCRSGAMHLGAQHQLRSVGLDRSRQRIEETRPAGAAVEFLGGGEQRLAAAGAIEGAGALLVIERATSRRLVPCARMILNCSGVSSLRHSASVCVTGYCLVSILVSPGEDQSHNYICLGASCGDTLAHVTDEYEYSMAKGGLRRRFDDAMAEKGWRGRGGQFTTASAMVAARASPSSGFKRSTACAARDRNNRPIARPAAAAS